MPPAEFPFTHRGLDFLWKFQQAEKIGDGRALFADAFGHLFLCELTFLNQAPVRDPDFNGVQMLALQVLDQSEFQHLLVRLHTDNVCRDACKPRLACGTDASLSGDKLIPTGHPAHRNRLDNTLFLDGSLQLVKRTGIEVGPRLKRIARYAFNGDVDNNLVGFTVIFTGAGQIGRRRTRARDQRSKATTKNKFAFSHEDIHTGTVPCGTGAQSVASL